MASPETTAGSARSLRQVVGDRFLGVAGGLGRQRGGRGGFSIAACTGCTLVADG
ncbi:hypothetical protein [Alloactinosynnema sp. L-07]|nr:hypothetical protein [Alloactinosynnema sp. L-07]